MVNVGFPENNRYGFEMVDAADACRISRAGGASIETLWRIKPVGILANFRRVKLNAMTCDLSMTAR
jgi:hypothetical protein